MPRYGQYCCVFSHGVYEMVFFKYFVWVECIRHSEFSSAGKTLEVGMHAGV